MCTYSELLKEDPDMWWSLVLYLYYTDTPEAILVCDTNVSNKYLRFRVNLRKFWGMIFCSYIRPRTIQRTWREISYQLLPVMAGSHPSWCGWNIRDWQKFRSRTVCSLFACHIYWSGHIKVWGLLWVNYAVQVHQVSKVIYMCRRRDPSCQYQIIDPHICWWNHLFVSYFFSLFQQQF